MSGLLGGYNNEVFVYDHRGLLLEIRDGQFINPVIARYYYAAFDGEVPIAMDLREEGGTNMIRYYSLSDRQGSIVGLMGEDGTVVERVAYDTWGAPWVTTSNVQTVAPYASSLGNRLLFQSHLWDPDVDLYFMRARVFDPFRGEFLQRDPSGYADSVNMYAGFANDPVDNRDPTGRNVPKKIGEKVVDRVLRWLAGRGKTVCNHTAKRHAARRTISARLVSKLGNGTALAMVRKSKFLKDSTIKKLITRAVENPTREVLQRGGGPLSSSVSSIEPSAPPVKQRFEWWSKWLLGRSSLLSQYISS